MLAAAEETRSTVPASAKVAAALLIALALCGRAIYVFTPVNSDTAMFVYAGKLVANGGRPGVDLLDNKLPSVGLLMQVPERLFGAAWPTYGLLGLAMSVVASLMLWRLARRWLGESAAIFVAVASVLWLNFTPAVYGQLQLETIGVFFSALAAGCVAEWLAKRDLRDAFVAGMCGGMGMWAKPTAGAVLAAAVIAMLLFARGRWWPRIAGIYALAAGAALPIIVCLKLILATGMAGALPETLRQLRDYAAASNFDWSDVAKPIFVVAVLLFPLLILGLICRRDRLPRQPRPSGLGAFVLIWFGCELAAVISQRRMYAYHFIVLAPPAALLCGLIARRVSMRSLQMAFGPPTALAFWLAMTMVPQIGAPTRDSRMIAYVKANALPTQSVWVDDYPRLLMETDLAPGSAVPLIFLFANSDSAPAFFGERLLADFDARRPAMVILPTDIDRLIELYHHNMADVAGSPRRAEAMGRMIRQIDGYVRRRYHPAAEIDGLTVWQRDSATIPAQAVPPTGR